MTSNLCPISLSLVHPALGTRVSLTLELATLPFLFDLLLPQIVTPIPFWPPGLLRGLCSTFNLEAFSDHLKNEMAPLHPLPCFHGTYTIRHVHFTDVFIPCRLWACTHTFTLEDRARLARCCSPRAQNSTWAIASVGS